MQKPKIIKDFDKLSEEVLEQIKLIYPKGFKKHLISFVNKEGKIRKALPFETEDFHYLIRMSSAEAESIILKDEDYDEDGLLKENVKIKYEDKHEDVDFLNDLNSNEDNELGKDDDEME